LIGVDKFTLEQLEALRNYIQRLEWDINRELLIGAHNECDTAISQGKTCPNMSGENLRKYIRCCKFLDRLKIKKQMEV